MKTHVYGRVSKSNKKNYGGSNIDIQFDECREHCLSRGWDRSHIIYHVQERSARNGDNLLELNAILNEMESGDTMVVYTIDRLSRNTLAGIDFLERLIKKGCRLESVCEKLVYDNRDDNDDSMYDRYKIRDIINHAELESDRLSIRTRRAKRHQKLAKHSSGPMLSSTKFQCRKRRRSELDNLVEEGHDELSNQNILGEHMGIDGVATRSMIRVSKKRKIEVPDDDTLVRITTRNNRVNRNNLLRGALERYTS
jgi:DNA invertase Pin-like site-specific DNA recombinase